MTPACKRGDVNGGGGIYQVLQFNNKLYVVVCVGDEASQNPDNGMKTSFAIVRGELTGTDATKRENWHWSVLAGNTEGEGDAKAKYAYGMDPERVSNLEKARENARAFGDEVRRLVPLRTKASARRAA